MGKGLHISGMSLHATWAKKTFHFNFRARTSRGAMLTRDSWIIKMAWKDQPACVGLGEAGPLPGLSQEAGDTFEETLSKFVDLFNHAGIDRKQLAHADWKSASRLVQEICPAVVQFPSVLFGLETALLDLHHGGRRMLFSNDFVQGVAIPINGLIWMGGMDEMLQQIEIKIQEGFRCLKLKVGGLDFEKECDILQYIRRKYFRMDIGLRLDANGAFKPDEAMYKLHELSRYKIHSIEQPIKAGMADMAALCAHSPIPVALDEELIGVHSREEKEKLLSHIKPPFIILKPTLHGGLAGCSEWIELANTRGIGWWLTSALESNIGLNAIAQFASSFDNPLPQGLGTGRIYEDNIPAPLETKDGMLCYDPSASWDLAPLS